jgi:hypothetical protein
MLGAHLMGFHTLTRLVAYQTGMKKPPEGGLSG